MKLLEERIRTHGKIREGGVLKVDSFLNCLLYTSDAADE